MKKIDIQNGLITVKTNNPITESAKSRRVSRGYIESFYSPEAEKMVAMLRIADAVCASMPLTCAKSKVFDKSCFLEKHSGVILYRLGKICDSKRKSRTLFVSSRGFFLRRKRYCIEKGFLEGGYEEYVFSFAPAERESCEGIYNEVLSRMKQLLVYIAGCKFYNDAIDSLLYRIYRLIMSDLGLLRFDRKEMLLSVCEELLPKDEYRTISDAVEASMSLKDHDGAAVFMEPQKANFACLTLKNFLFFVPPFRTLMSEILIRTLSSARKSGQNSPSNNSAVLKWMWTVLTQSVLSDCRLQNSGKDLQRLRENMEELDDYKSQLITKLCVGKSMTEFRASDPYNLLLEKRRVSFGS